jgi:DNA-binding winged helix-turn-helix (wHTH) protein/tetratricopeptide (TPR) repeat protein
VQPIKAFPPFRLDPENGYLWRENNRILLAPKAFAVLRYLVEHAGRLVSQAELLEAVWPKTYVQPEVLRKYILDIRRVLQDPPKNPRFVETLPKRGYRFIAPTRDEMAGPAISYPPHLGGSGTLVGREAVLSELEGCLNLALRGERQVIFVTGDAGIGKTSLVDFFHRECLLRANCETARGQCVEGFGGKEAYYPVLEAFGLFMRAPGGDSLVRTLATQAPTWLIQFPSLVSPEERGVLLQEILGATRDRMVREFCEAMEFRTAGQPLVLILEDLQWVDDSTLDLISALARRRGPAKLMLVATYRPVDVILSRSPLKVLKQDLLVHHLCREIGLSPLTASDVEEYLGAEFPNSSLGQHLAGMVHRHSDGNPMFMVALLEQLQQQQLIARVEGRWTVTVPAEKINLGVPETLQQMLETQLERLDEREQVVVRAASVCGHRFSVWAVSTMTNNGAGQVEGVCEALAGRQQFVKRGGIQELADGTASTQYEFKHALYREVLYRQLTPTQRRQFHLRLAGRMESLSTPADPALASELAAHFEAGRDYARAIRYLILTASTATRRYAHGDAVKVLHHAIELRAHLPAASGRELEIEILERISDCLYAQGEMVQSAEVDYKVADLAALGGFKVAQVNALTRVARALAFLEPDNSVAVCERAAGVARTHDDPLLQARTEMLMASWRIVTNGWTKEDAEICAAARARIHALSDELPEYHEILYAHVQWTQGDYAGACRTARAGIPRSIENDNLVVYLSAHSSLAQALLHLGNWGELLEVVSTALDVAQKNGNVPWLGIFRATLAWLRFHAGDIAGALQLSESLLSTHREENAGQVETMARVTAGFASLESGALDQAQKYFTDVSERPARPRFFMDWYWRLEARLGMANLLLARGETSKAAAEAEGLLQSALSTADPALQALAWQINASAAQAQGDPDRALTCLNEALAIGDASGVPFAAWRVHRTASELYGKAGNRTKSEEHRARADRIIGELADSLPAAEPLRRSLLARRTE